jgi:hypothetical protein
MPQEVEDGYGLILLGRARHPGVRQHTPGLVDGDPGVTLKIARRRLSGVDET